MTSIFPEDKPGITKEKPHNAKIIIEDLSTWFGRKKILKNISCYFEDRNVTAIMGPSGCGKSTLLRTMNRLNDLIGNFKATGKIFIEGDDILRPEANVYSLRAKVGMVFQRPNPFPMSIKDNITYGPSLQGINDEDEQERIVETCLKKAALWDEVKDNLDHPAPNLSGGQQQRLCIARALSVNPPILLMDEPVSALDPLSASKIEDLIIELKKEYAIIMVTHNVQQAFRVSDQAAFLYLGELVEFDKTKRIAEAPADDRTEAFITGRIG
ncbi:MAG: phosphate ABC transporter ATP-binding protein [Candidatus Thorarchaeota archaeon]|nr:phosphate ABC transporter ATP-binding protein [Candidatus Thorarchaeota archaeon]